MTTTRVIVWLTEGTWAATIDATSRVLAAAPTSGTTTDRAVEDGVEVRLLHVIDAEITEALHGAFGGLLGRGHRDRAPAATVADQAARASSELLEAAARRLARPATRLTRTGRIEREVVTACAGATLLVCARDGDHTRLGPGSLGHHTRFVVDHAPCAVLLIWPDQVPDLTSIPPPPQHPPSGHRAGRQPPPPHPR